MQMRSSVPKVCASDLLSEDGESINPVVVLWSAKSRDKELDGCST